MRKKIFASLGALLCFSVVTLVVVFGSRDATRNYGNTSSPVLKKRAHKPQCQVINRNGLTELNASGSALINYNDFAKNVGNNYKNLYMISLMFEDTYYYKGRCLRWYGYGYTPQTLGQKNHERKHRAFTRAVVRLIYGIPPSDPGNIELVTEKQLIKKLGIQFYEPLRNYPDWLTNHSYIDDLIKIFEKIPREARVYFHCIHGRGRTTTFMVFYDIFRNGKKISLEDITTRHHCLGRENLLDVSVWKKGSWSQEALKMRRDLVTRFYDYVTSPEGYPHCTWAEWSDKQGYDTATPVRIHRRSQKDV